ncbi:MAG TPA: tetratricopeptide repeat protein [Puia sp.]|nr:tetratricopeptide repeat protein [Puia sp.]
MNSKIRFSLLVVSMVGISNLVIAQTVEQGRKFYYYTRYKSAKETLEKVLASNPNNIDAVYWLGETLLQLKDSAAAEAQYSKALQTNGSAPLLLVGMGHVELRKGKASDARQRFETAISLSKGKDVGVLNAIGSANADIRVGDANYAIEKLTQATQVKNFNNAETYVIMGDAYRKLVDGGNSVQSYQKALTLDPKFAAAKFKIGMIYLTQNNKDYFLPAFEEAVTMDPNYGPALYELYFYWYTRDVNKSKDYLDKYLAVSDADPSNDYLRTSILFAAKRYDEAISGAKSFISSQGDKADVRFYKLAAYSYDAKGDSASAKSYLDQYFAKQKPDDFLPKDYSFRAQVLSKFRGNDSLVTLNYQLAISKDTAVANKLDIMKEAADNAKKAGNKIGYAYWQGQLYLMNKNPTNTDLYNWGFSNYSAGNYKTADSIFCGIYEAKYPNEIFGFLWCKNSLFAQDDSLGSKGIAVDAFDKLAAKARELDSIAKAANSPDSIKYKSQAVNSYFYLAGYYNNYKKDKAMALSYLGKVLELDPENAMARQYINVLSKPPARQQPPARPKPAAGK